MKKIHSLPILFAAVLLLALASCSTTADTTLTGDGTSITQTRTVADFTNVIVNGSQTVHLIYAAQQKVEVVGANNLQPYFLAEVNNGTLQLGYVDTVSVSSDNISVNVYTPSINAFTINGSGAADVTGNYYGQNPTFTINGDATLSLYNIASYTVNANVNGNGVISGLTSVCETLNANIVGAGRIEMRVLTTLNGTVNGAGAIVYDGSPTLNSNISNGGLIYHK